MPVTSWKWDWNYATEQRVRHEGNSQYFKPERFSSRWFANRIWNEMFRLRCSCRMVSGYMRFMPEAHRFALHLRKPTHLYAHWDSTEIWLGKGSHSFFHRLIALREPFLAKGRKSSACPFPFPAVHISTWLSSIVYDRVTSCMTCGSSALDRIEKHKDRS